MKFIMFFLLLASVLLSCAPARENDQSKSMSKQIGNTENRQLPDLQLWASKKVTVCLNTLALESPYIDGIRSRVIEEFNQVDFDFSEGWRVCSQNEQIDFRLDINMNNDVDPRYGGSAPVGTFLGRKTELTIRANPLTFSDKDCQNNPHICIQEIAIHEVGHTLGLPHTHTHPNGHSTYQMPVHYNNESREFVGYQYHGDYDGNSVMSYARSGIYQKAKLSKGDIRALKAMYNEPSVFLTGQSAESNGKYVKNLSIQVVPQHRHTGPLPTHYKYKIVGAKESCHLNMGYSPWQSLSVPITADLTKLFPLGKDVKLCALGKNGDLEQTPESFSNLFFKVGEDLTKNYNFNGTFYSNGCSGFFGKFAGSQKVYAITNAHCLSLNRGDVVVDQVAVRSFYPLDSKGKRIAQVEIKSKKILYASYGITDVAILELAQQEQIQQHNIQVFTLAKQAPQAGQKVSVITGLFSEGYSCEIEKIVAELREDTAYFSNAMRYSSGCSLFPGTSGSPMIDFDSPQIVLGINSTGNEHGMYCSDSNPCEVDDDNMVTAKKGYGYALQTSYLYGCFNSSMQLDLSLKDCKLPKPTDVPVIKEVLNPPPSAIIGKDYFKIFPENRACHITKIPTQELAEAHNYSEGTCPESITVAGGVLRRQMACPVEDGSSFYIYGDEDVACP